MRINFGKKLILFMSIVIIIFIIIYIVINNLNENINNVEPSDNIIIAIYPTGTDSETYYFDINVDGKLTAIFGTRKTDNIVSKNFISYTSDVEEKVVNLYQKDIVHILKLLKEIENNKDSLNYKIVYDSWDIAIYYNLKSYKINYYTDNAYVKELINLLIDISPIHVDLHGWS